MQSLYEFHYTVLEYNNLFNLNYIESVYKIAPLKYES